MVEIKGMEIPKSCSQCKLCVEDKYADMTCVLLCEEWEENDYNENHRDERCPLVEIVTCKDCKYNYENSCDFDGFGIDDDYFCAKAERKE